MATLVVGFLAIGVATLVVVEPAVDLASVGFCPPCDPNPLRIAIDPGAFALVNSLGNIVEVLLVGAVIIRILARWYAASAPSRRVLLPVLFGGGVAALGILVATVSQLVLFEIDDVAYRLLVFLRILVPFGLAISLVRLRLTRAAVAEAIVALGPSPSTVELQDVLRRAVADPSLVVVRWSGAAGAYLDDEGRPIEPNDDGDRVIIGVDRDSPPSVAIGSTRPWPTIRPWRSRLGRPSGWPFARRSSEPSFRPVAATPPGSRAAR